MPPSRPGLMKLALPFDTATYHPQITQAFGNDAPGLEPACWAYGNGVYGFRWLTGASQSSWHLGVDYGLNNGTPVRAAADGVVEQASWDEWGFGNLTILAHKGGLLTFYAHQERFSVAAGATVTAGQVIGYVDSTGNSTGAHLHFATAEHDGSGYYYFFDPAPYLTYQTPLAEQPFHTGQHFTVLVDMYLRTSPVKTAPHGRFVTKGTHLVATGGWTTNWRSVAPTGDWAFAPNLAVA